MKEKALLVVAALALASLPDSSTALARPDPAGAARALVGGAADALGDSLGGLGFLTSNTLALAGDGLSLIDANRWTQPLLRGVLSRPTRRLALAASWSASGLVQGLRAEDIERLPEDSHAYLGAARGVGRIDGLLGAGEVLGLGVRDAAGALPRAIFHLVGAKDTAARVESWLDAARDRALGPLAAD